jgi:hypothetical protein
MRHFVPRYIPVVLAALSFTIIAAINSPRISSQENLVKSEERDGAVFFFNRAERRLLAYGLDDGAFLSEVQLDKTPKFMVPTPGGVSLFVGFENSSIIEVYSSLDFSLQKSIDLGIQDPQWLSFSRDGSTILVQSAEGSLFSFSHSLLNLSNRRESPESMNLRSLIPNRRADRWYAATAQGIAIVFNQNLRTVETLPIPASQIIFGEDFSSLWVADENSTVQVLDPRSGEIINSFDQRVLNTQPAAYSGMSFLKDDGESVLHFPEKGRGRVRDTSLSIKASILLSIEGERLWAVSYRGEVEILGPGGPRQFDLGMEIDAAVTAVVKTEGAFACF